MPQGPAETAILFDLDGTLVDTLPDLAAAANGLLQELGAAPLPAARVRDFVGHDVAALVARVLRERGLEDEVAPSEALPRFDRLYRAGLTTGSQPFPGVPAALRRLRDAGHPLAVCTNKPHDLARAILDGLALSPLVEVLVGGGDAPRGKPDPGPLLLALERLGVRRGVMVGDSEVDAEAAERAGLPFALFTRGYLHVPADSLATWLCFEAFDDLPSLLQERLADEVPSVS